MSAVVGRDAELSAIASLLELGDARVLLLEGVAGIGKTAVWRAGVEEARAKGIRVLSCEAAGAEASLAFTGVRDLIEDVFDDIAHELPAPQRHAVEVALLRAEPDVHAAEQGTVAVALLTALRLLASQGPTLVALDDAQWLDADSATALHYVVRRLGDENVAVLVARRPLEALDPLGLDRLDARRLRKLELGQLSIGALGRMLHERLDVVYPRPTLQRVHEASGGNAFFALEIARALSTTSDTLRPGSPLPVPNNLRELVEDRLATLPAETLSVLAIVAGLARATLPLVAAAHGGDPSVALTAAVDARIVEVDGDSARFAHPLFAAAVAERAPLTRRALHARLADVVTDHEQRARHLALASDAPSEEVAAVVERGAAVAFSRGSPAAAAQLAAEAVRLTPPAGTDETLRRALAEVDYQFAAGDLARASALLDELVANAPPGTPRARLLSRQGRVRHFELDVDTSVRLLYDALAEAGDDDVLRGEIEEGLAWGLLLTRDDLREAAEHARSAATLADRRGDAAALAEGLAVEALADFVLGRPWQATMERALALEHATLHLRVLRHPSFAYGYCLSCSDDFDRARTVFEQLRQRATDAGDEGSVPTLLNHLALIECLAGHWQESAELVDECYQRALESAQQPTQRSILGKAALLAVRRGSVADARAKAAEALGPDFDPAAPEDVAARGGETATWALGSLELALDDAAEAHRLLGPMTNALIAAGIQEPGELRALPDEIEALVLLGEEDRAEELHGHLRTWARRVDRPSALAAAGRCEGVLHAARGDADAALAELESAATLSARAGMPFEHGRTLLALGAQQRRARQRRAARETLDDALSIFDELGAELMAEKARAELGRIGGRRAQTGELTATERRIAQLVAEGKTNKEVAAILVVAERTVESALTQIYRKLDVRSRTELARKLAGDG